MSFVAKSKLEVAIYSLKFYFNSYVSSWHLRNLERRETKYRTFFATTSRLALFGNKIPFELEIHQEGGLMFSHRNKIKIWNGYIPIKSARFAELILKRLPILKIEIEKAMLSTDDNLTIEICQNQLAAPIIHINDSDIDTGLWELEIERKDEYMAYNLTFRDFDLLNSTYKLTD